MKPQRHNFLELSRRADQYVGPIRSYLDFLIEGDGKKPHCPFAGAVIAKRQFYYDVSNAFLTKDECHSVLDEMKNFHSELNNKLAVICVVYEHVGNLSDAVALQVEHYRQEKRLELLALGLTIAFTHPQNPMGTHTDKSKPEDPLWITETPMLMLRSLDKSDEPFMKDDAAKRAFIIGMKYQESIPFFGDLSGTIADEKRIQLLSEIMDHDRLSSIKSVSVARTGISTITFKTGMTVERRLSYPEKGCRMKGGVCDCKTTEILQGFGMVSWFDITLHCKDGDCSLPSVPSVMIM